MSRYLSNNPGHVQYLDLVRLNVGFRAHFTAIGDDDTADAVPRSAAKRAEHAVANGIARLEGIVKDTTVTDDVRHEHAGIVFKAVQKEVLAAAESIRRHGKREAEAARDRAFAVLNDADTALHGEIRAYLREQAAKGDPDWPAKLAEMVRTSRNTAAAINVADGYLSGISEDRKVRLVTDALIAHSPDDAEAVVRNGEVARQADKMEAGLRQLGAAWFSPANAQRATNSRTDPHAPLVPGEPATVGG